jgi:hypothetical protein
MPGRLQPAINGSWRRCALRTSPTWLLDASLAAVTLGGVLILWPQLGQVGAQASGGSQGGAEIWLAHAASSPAQTVLGTLTAAVDWTGRLTDSLGIAGLSGLILLAIPLFAWLRRLMPEVEEGAPA